MAFDIKNQADLTALKQEIDNDPLSLGYAAVVTVTRDLLDIINAKNYTVQKPIQDLIIPEISSAIDPVEFSNLGEFDKEFVKMFINKPSDSPLKPFKDKMLNLFPAGSTTRNNILALRDQSGSRAEVLFGAGTTISRRDYLEARDNG